MTPTSAYTVAVDTQTPIGYIATNYLNKSQHGTVVDVAVQFDTAMNTSIPGTASLSIPSTASSYSLSSAGWTGNTLWTGQFTFNDVDDANIDATTGTFNVSGFEDAVGNVMDPLARNIVVDTKQPTVGSVDSLTPDGTYGVGYGVDITVNFTEPVTMTGDNLTVRFADFPTTCSNLGQFPLSTRRARHVHRRFQRRDRLVECIFSERHRSRRGHAPRRRGKRRGPCLVPAGRQQSRG